MKHKEFLLYLENNSEAYKIFMNKAMQYQRAKNAKRQKQKRWDEDKMRCAAYDMWKSSMENLYNQLKQQVNSNHEFMWKDFIEKNNILESVNDGIREMDFISEE
ncbi:MAG: hypothetical protein LBS02_18335 [Hungatella sp.]|jgi:hypothetical protein|nr:hypothetical protein [Hungatella sp.]